MRIWLSHGADLPKQLAADAADPESEIIKIDIKKPAGDQAQVVLRVSTPSQPRLVLPQQWVQMAGVWYFQPPKLRSVIAGPAAARRAEAARSGPLMRDRDSLLIGMPDQQSTDC